MTTTNFIELIEKTRTNTEPKIGDIIQFTNKYGDYFHNGHIDKIIGDKAIICTEPYIPFVYINYNDEKQGITCSTSGGYFEEIDKNKLIYIGKKKKCFKLPNNDIFAKNSSIEFEAEVSVWEYAEDNMYIKDGKTFTTKDYNKMFIHCDKNRNNPFSYKYIGKNIAWQKDKELQVWLRTYRAEIFHTPNENSMLVWYWKEYEHQVSPEDFEKLDLSEDTILINTEVYRCKRFYNEEKHEIHTYYVWYWKEEGDFYEISEKQNKIRKKYYLTHDRLHKLALLEFQKGIAQPVDLSFLE